MTLGRNRREIEMVRLTDYYKLRSERRAHVDQGGPEVTNSDSLICHSRNEQMQK
jgi:hypothetical protein